MPTSYPSSGIDNFSDPTATTALNDATAPHATQHASLNRAVNAIETELGLNPKGTAASVAARLTNIESTVLSTLTSIDGSSGSDRSLTMKSGGSARWSLTTNSTAESSPTIAGSDFEVRSYNDSGAARTGTGILSGSTSGAVLRITRSTGAVALGGALTVAGNTTLSGTTTLTNAVSINGGGTIASGTTLTNNGTITGGTVNATSLQQGGVSAVLNSGTWSISITGNSATSTLATKASTLALGGANGSAATFNYAAAGTQPTYLWATSNGGTNNVYPISNLAVDTANSSAYAQNSGTADVANTVKVNGTGKKVISGQKTITPTGSLAPGAGYSVPFTETNGYYVVVSQANGSPWSRVIPGTSGGNNYLAVYNTHPTSTFNFGTVYVNWIGVEV